MFMKSKKNLVFLGMMGSGKSSIGSLVSKKLSLNFIDIDNIIEEETNMSILEIFNKKGENFFRSLEEKITLKSLKMHRSVISLGGGGFINDKIRKEVLSNHISFWLNCNESTLLSRIKASKKRPLVFNSTEKEIKDLIKKRDKIYSKADYAINCDKLIRTKIVKKIVDTYELI
jgi:shikimate kinase